MRYVNLREEKKLWRKGYKMVVGLDEAGRGPLAGPVVASAVIVRQIPIVNSLRLKKLLQQWQVQGIKDSKKLTAAKREKFYEVLAVNPSVEWGIGRVSEKAIDKINILEATKLAMEKAISNLEKKIRARMPACQKYDDRHIFGMPSFLIIDGNFSINSSIPQKSIIKADEKVFSCVAAGIVAKVSRDRMMLRYHKKYPQYGFDKHKGYPTKLHREMLKKHGFCEIHRRSFRVS